MTGIRRFRTTLLTLAILNFLVAHEALAATDPTELKSAVPAARQDPAEPGDHHRHLDALVGDWDYTMRIWNSPEAEPLELVGTSKARWILDGRFVETYYHGEIQGRPFEGRSIDGYDNKKKNYTTIWQDNLGTYTVVSEGNCTEDGRVRTMSYQFDDAASGLTLTNENVTTVIDENTNQSESFIKSTTGVSFKNMELKRTRKTPHQPLKDQTSD